MVRNETKTESIFARCLAAAELRKASHYEREATATRRVMSARGEPEALIEARCQPGWWQNVALWDEEILDGDAEPRIHSYEEQDAIRGVWRAARRATAQTARLGHYRVRIYRPSSRFDMTPVLRWTIWQWRQRLRPQPQLISDVEHYLAAERALWKLHDQYDPEGTRIAVMEAEAREEREWRQRRSESLAQLELPWSAITLVDVPVSSRA